MEREVRLTAEKRCEYRLEWWRQAGEVEQVKTNGTDIRQSGGKAKTELTSGQWSHSSASENSTYMSTKKRQN